MNTESMNIIIFGLSLNSAPGNKSASTWRSLIKGLLEKGHKVTFLEQAGPLNEGNGALTGLPQIQRHVYENPGILKYDHGDLMRDADLVILGSHVQHVVDIGKWITDHAEGLTAYYDFEPRKTLAGLEKHAYKSITPGLVPKFDFYFAQSEGEALTRLTEDYKAPPVKQLGQSVDGDLHEQLLHSIG